VICLVTAPPPRPGLREPASAAAHAAPCSADEALTRRAAARGQGRRAGLFVPRAVHPRAAPPRAAPRRAARRARALQRSARPRRRRGPGRREEPWLLGARAGDDDDVARNRPSRAAL